MTWNLRRMVRSSLLSLAACVACCSCSSPEAVRHNVVVDLNRTSSADAYLRSVLVPDSVVVCDTVRVDSNGSYVFGTEGLPTGVYLLSLESLNLPLLVRQGESQRVCGSLQQWDRLTFSSSETSALVRTDALRGQLASMVDSVHAHGSLATPAARRAVADSLNAVRALVRRQADSLLAHNDTSLVSLVLLNLQEVYDPTADAALFRRVLDNVEARYSCFFLLKSLRERQTLVAKMSRLKSAFASGNSVDDVFFQSSTGEVLTAGMFGRRPVAFAVLGDSLSPRVSALLRENAALNGVALIEGKAPVGKQQFVGRFSSLPCKAEMADFLPVVITIGADGTINRLYTSVK